MSEGQSAKAIFIENRCHKCHKVLVKPPTLISHLKTQHQIIMFPRPTGSGRPQNKAYSINQRKTDGCEIHVGCPSCWFHCPESDMEGYIRHIEEAHFGKAIEEYINPNIIKREEDDFNSTYIPNDYQPFQAYYNTESSEDQLRRTIENQILAAVESLTENFKRLFNR